MNAQRRGEPGPQLGAPPSLEQIPLDRLHVDPAYQRATDSPASRAIIAGMVRSWDWSLCQPLVVARRQDGSLYILDGQHRHAGAKERGDIPYLPCVILSTLDHAGEARTFVQLNTRRQRLSQGQIFHGMLAAGDAHARLVQQLLDGTGWRLRQTSNTGTYKAGDLECAPMLVRMVAAKGENHVRFALTTLRAAYPDTPVRQTATLIKALIEVFDVIQDNDISVATLIAAIAAVQPLDWVTRGLVMQERHRNMAHITGIARAMIAAAKGEPAPEILRPVAPPRTVAAPVAAPAPRIARDDPQTPVFGSSGKGWCDQCDQLRSREAARACPDRFCKLRPHV